MTDLGELEKRLAELGFSGRLERDVRLARYTTYRLGGPAALVAEPGGTGDLEHLAAALRQIGSVDVLPLGRGSNLVVSDSGWPGLVVRLGTGFGSMEQLGATGARVGGAASLPQLANWTARRGLAGLEFAIAIPGSVGGAVRMNAGAHGGDIASVLAKATIFSFEEGGSAERTVESLGFAYRRSALTDREVVVDATFELTGDDPGAVKERVDSFRKQRAATQPGALQNAGSVFKNPAGDHAGRLVEAAGLKGFSVGGASVSEVHANFFIAADGASAQDVFDLVSAVRKRVHESFGVSLEPEVRFVGSFREHAQAGDR